MIPVSGVSGPPGWMASAGLLVQLIAAFQDLHVLPTVALRRRHVPNPAVAMFQVVPMHESRRPGPRITQVRKPVGADAILIS